MIEWNIEAKENSDVDTNLSKTSLANFTIINTNSHSLSPKLTSLVNCMNEMDARIAIVTKT